MIKYFLLAGTLICTVYGQLIIKVRSEHFASTSSGETGVYLIRMLTDLQVYSGFAAAGVAGVCWMLAIRTMPVAYAYPFMALSFVLVPLGAHFFIHEPLTWAQTVGLALIVIGVTINALFN